MDVRTNELQGLVFCFGDGLKEENIYLSGISSKIRSF